MVEIVGGIAYTVTLDTAQMVAGQRRVDSALAKSAASVDSFQSKLSEITSAVKAYAAATFLIANTDAYTKLNAQLKLATDGHSSLAVAQDQVRKISQEAQTDISALGTLYARITNATKDLGTSQFKVGEITRVVALSMKVSGASAAEASSAMLQLSQAFASGVLRGEEFNSVSEAAPRLMKALADGVGVPIGRLRAMAEAGKLTTSVLMDALPKALGALEQEAKQVQTISGAFQVLKNEVMLLVGAETTASGAAQQTAQVLATLAANLDLVAAAAYGFGAAKLAQVLLSVSVAAVANTKAVLDGIVAQQASAAATVASAQANIQHAATVVAGAEAEIAATAVKTAGLQATQGAIAGARAEMMARLALSNASIAGNQASIAATRATIVSTAAQLESARAAGALSFAIAVVRESQAALAVQTAALTRQEAALTAATTAHSAAVAELAILGRQQAAVSAQITAATNAQTVASRGLISANSALAAAQMGATVATGATSGAMIAARGVMGALGGPIGIITTLLGIGATAWMLWGNNAKTAGDQATVAMGQALKAQSDNSKQISNLDKVIDKERAKGADADESRIARLQGLRQNAVNAELAAQKEITGLKMQKDGQETIQRNYVTRYENPAVIQKRQLDAQKAFLDANLTNQQKYQEESKKLRGEMGPLYTPEVDTALKKKHHLDKADPNAGKADSAKKYYEGLVADNSFALEKIDAQEREAMAENAARAAKDTANAGVYAAARVEIQKKFARERYQLEEKNSQEIAELNIATTTDEGLKVELIRAEAMRRADAGEKAGITTHAEAERARTLATFNAEKARADLADRNTKAQAYLSIANAKSQEQRIVLIRDEAIRQAEAAYTRGAATFAEAEAAKAAAVKSSIEQQKALEASRTQTNISTLQITAEYGGAEDKIALIQAQAAAELAANQAAWALDLDAHQLYADRKVAIEQSLALKIREIQAASATTQMAMAQSSAGDIYSVLQKAGKERTAIGKAVFLAERAIAVATIIVNTDLAAAKAMGTLGVFGIPMSTMIRATGYASAAAVGTMAVMDAFGGGRATGGPVSGDKLYQVGEGGRPEMFQTGGKNYLIPGDNGKVVSNGDMQGGAASQVVVQIINNHPTAQVTQKTDERGQMLQYVISELSGQVTSNSGQFFNALKSSTNVRGAGL
ncbi:tape measure protein [Xylophilus sp. Kf1]|nr:tape measure protein [Xylophilus sp. Kf1]